MIDNPNPNNFYTPQEMEMREKYIPKAKEDVLKKLEDLKSKIQNEEPFPEKNMSLDELVEIGTTLERFILDKWNY